MDESPESAFERWQRERVARLVEPEGWFSLVGLFWLEPGRSRVGSDPGCPVPLPLGPAFLGELVWEPSGIAWFPAPGCPAIVEGAAGEAPEGGLRLATDEEGRPSLMRLDTLSFFIIEREGRVAVRVKDRGWAEHRPFLGLECFPFDPDWIVEARWQALEPPLELEVPTMTGEIKRVRVENRAVFAMEGVEVSLLPLEEDEEGVFFVFSDGSSGSETYGGGRFLRTGPVEDDGLLLDFNRAYNPPCAFSPFATCPLPPAGNQLPFAVRAGEKKYPGAAG